MPAGEEIALQPALALMLAEHLHHPAVGGEVIVVVVFLGHPCAVGDFERILPAVRVVLVRAEKPEVSRLHVQRHDVTQVTPHDASQLRGDGTGGCHRDSVVGIGREPQIPEEQAAVRVRIGAHAAVAFGGGRGEFRPEPSFLCEEFVGPVALHPGFENWNVLGDLVHRAHRHLMGAPIVLGALAIDLLGARPAFRRAEHDHGPEGAFSPATLARFRLDALDLADDACPMCRPSSDASRPGRSPRRNRGCSRSRGRAGRALHG